MKKLEKIEIFEISNEKKTLIASTFIDFSKSSNDLKEKREQFHTKLIQAVNENDKKMKKNAFELDDISEDFKLVIQTNIFDKNAKQMIQQTDKYLVINCVKLKSASKELSSLADKTATFPMCGVAYKINQTLDGLNEKYK